MQASNAIQRKRALEEEEVIGAEKRTRDSLSVQDLTLEKVENIASQYLLQTENLIPNIIEEHCAIAYGTRIPKDETLVYLDFNQQGISPSFSPAFYVFSVVNKLESLGPIYQIGFFQKKKIVYMPKECYEAIKMLFSFEGKPINYIESTDQLYIKIKECFDLEGVSLFSSSNMQTAPMAPLKKLSANKPLPNSSTDRSIVSENLFCSFSKLTPCKFSESFSKFRDTVFFNLKELNIPILKHTTSKYQAEIRSFSGSGIVRHVRDYSFSIQESKYDELLETLGIQKKPIKYLDDHLFEDFVESSLSRRKLVYMNNSVRVLELNPRYIDEGKMVVLDLSELKKVKLSESILISYKCSMHKVFGKEISIDVSDTKFLLNSSDYEEIKEKVKTLKANSDSVEGMRVLWKPDPE